MPDKIASPEPAEPPAADTPRASVAGGDLMTRQSALDLLPKQNALIAQLWAMYVTATFAAAVLNLRQGEADWRISTAVTLGFAAFAIGHWSLLLQAIRVSQAVAADLKPIAEKTPTDFDASIQALLRTANGPRLSAICHIVIDLCVIASIWAKSLEG